MYKVICNNKITYIILLYLLDIKILYNYNTLVYLIVKRLVLNLHNYYKVHSIKIDLKFFFTLVFYNSLIYNLFI